MSRDFVACTGGSLQCQRRRRPDCSTCAKCKQARGALVQASIGLRFGNLIGAARAVPELADAAAALEAACARRGEAPASWLQLECAAPPSVPALADQLERATAQLNTAWRALTAADTAQVGAGWECCLVDMLSGACARAPSLDAGSAPLLGAGSAPLLGAGGARSCMGCHPVAWGLFGESGSVTALIALSAAARFMVMTAPAVAAAPATAAGRASGPAHNCAGCPEFAHTAAAGVALRPAWLIDAWTARLRDCMQAHCNSRRDHLQIFSIASCAILSPW